MLQFTFYGFNSTFEIIGSNSSRLRGPRIPLTCLPSMCQRTGVENALTCGDANFKTDAAKLHPKAFILDLHLVTVMLHFPHALQVIMMTHLCQTDFRMDVIDIPFEPIRRRCFWTSDLSHVCRDAIRAGLAHMHYQESGVDHVLSFLLFHWQPSCW